MPVGMWCWPGPRAAAGVQEAQDGEHVLAVFLDPVNLVLTIPPFPNGPIVMAAFLRELARAAARMADTINPPYQRGTGGAHRAHSAASLGQAPQGDQP
jgi:hypothetical protein